MCMLNYFLINWSHQHSHCPEWKCDNPDGKVEGRWEVILPCWSLWLSSSQSLRLNKAPVTPRWFADAVYPSRTRLVILFEKSVSQRLISQLLALSHSHYKPVTSKGQLKGNVFREKRKKKKRKRFSACPFFSVHDITGLRYFGITASQWVIFPFLLYKNHKKKKPGSEEENSCVIPIQMLSS